MSQSHCPGDQTGRIHEILSHPKRRALLHSLRGVDTTTVETVAADLVEIEEPRFDGGVGPGKTGSLRVALHHQHLPKMADAGVLDYDSGSRVIETTRTTALVSEWIGRS